MIENNTTTYAKFEDIQQEIVKLLTLAKESVRICVAWINADAYRTVFQKLLATNVRIEVIYNSDYINAKFQFPEGIKTFAISPRLKSALMHNKFCIIDDEVVISGSFNWSRNASASFENIVVVRDNFHLVSAFKHEFDDLIAFCENPIKLNKCKKCGSYEYKLGLFGQECGRHSDSIFHVWAICVKNQHVRRVSEQHESYLHAQLGFLDNENQENWMQESSVDKSTMLLAFKQARNEMKRIQSFFDQRNLEVHALAEVFVSNQNEVIEYDEPEDRSVHIYWKNMHYRKIVPTKLYEDIGGVSVLMDEST